MTHPPARPGNLIWATRGRTWGFRFLLDAGLNDPLPAYERAFVEVGDSPTEYACSETTVAVRLPDPLKRRDAAGRLIPHEFVAFGERAQHIDSADDAAALLWPLVAHAYGLIWDRTNAPAAADLAFDTPNSEFGP